MRISVGVFFNILIVIVVLSFDFYRRVSTKMEVVSSSLPGRGEKNKKAGSGSEDDKTSLPCLS